MSPDGVVGSRNCCCHLFTVWTVDVLTSGLPCCAGARPSELLPRASRAIQLPDYQSSHLGPLALFCTADTLLIASCLFWLVQNWLLAYFLPPSSPIDFFAFVNFFVTRILPHHKPSCILSQHEVCYPFAVERLVGAVEGLVGACVSEPDRDTGMCDWSSPKSIM